VQPRHRPEVEQVGEEDVGLDVLEDGGDGRRLERVAGPDVERVLALVDEMRERA
jgi:hypothetical protein